MAISTFLGKALIISKTLICKGKQSSTLGIIGTIKKKKTVYYNTEMCKFIDGVIS